MARNPTNTEIQKSRNPKIISFENLKSPKKSGRFDTRGSPVALFVPEIKPKIPKNPEIQKFNILENPKSPKKSGRFDTSRSPVALFVAKIWPEIQKIQKSKNPKIHLFENLKSPQKSSRFATSGYPVALFVAEI